MVTGATWISRPPDQGDHFWPVPLAVVLKRFYLYLGQLPSSACSRMEMHSATAFSGRESSRGNTQCVFAWCIVSLRDSAQYKSITETPPPQQKRTGLRRQVAKQPSTTAGNPHVERGSAIALHLST